MLPDWSNDDAAAFFAVLGGVVGAALGTDSGFLVGLGVGAIVGGILDAWLNRFMHCWPLPAAGVFLALLAPFATLPAVIVFASASILAVFMMYLRDALIRAQRMHR